MREHVEGFAIAEKTSTSSAVVLQFSHGQSCPTYYVNVGGSREYVVRKKPPGKLLPSAHQVGRKKKRMLIDCHPFRARFFVVSGEFEYFFTRTGYVSAHARTHEERASMSSARNLLASSFRLRIR